MGKAARAVALSYDLRTIKKGLYMIKRAILNACGAWFCGLCVGLALCFYDYAGRVYFALDFVPNAIILAGMFAAIAWVSAFWEN